MTTGKKKEKGKTGSKAKKLELRKETLSDLSLKDKAAAVKGARGEAGCNTGSCFGS